MTSDMRIGINGTGTVATIDQLVADVRSAEEDGFASYWLAQIFGLDALTALAVAGAAVPRIELGTAVVPTFPRHPMMLGGQALTVQDAIGDRLQLGIGLSHQIVVENMWGYSWQKPVRHLREYLDALLPLLRGEAVDVHGEDLTCVGSLDVPGASAPDVLVAALGAQMLRLSGSRGCGTITWCTGERALLDHVVPRITAAAEEAGHPRPRVVAGLPVCVTDDADAARGIVAEQLAVYGSLPSYRAMLDLDGAEGPADISLIGDESEVGGMLDRLADGGVTEFSAVVIGVDDAARRRTREFLRSRI